MDRNDPYSLPQQQQMQGGGSFQTYAPATALPATTPASSNFAITRQYNPLAAKATEGQFNASFQASYQQPQQSPNQTGAFPNGANNTNTFGQPQTQGPVQNGFLPSAQSLQGWQAALAPTQPQQRQQPPAAQTYNATASQPQQPRQGPYSQPQLQPLAHLLPTNIAQMQNHNQQQQQPQNAFSSQYETAANFGYGGAAQQQQQQQYMPHAMGGSNAGGGYGGGGVQSASYQHQQFESGQNATGA